MYADQRYVPRSPRSVSLGAALAINGLVIAGLMSFVPNVITKVRPPGPIEIYTPKDEPPPPENPEIKPETDARPQEPRLYVPPTANPQPDQPPMETTNEMPTQLPPPGPATLPPGPASVPEVVLPPLIGAQQDPRYAGAFQPEYPAQELRMQRDGTVAVRVLIGVDGRVKAVEQVSATSAAFFEATKRQAMQKWRFKPATRGGVPQESWKVMNVRFRLQDA